MFFFWERTVASSVVADARPVSAVELGIPAWARGLRRRGNRGAGRQLGLRGQPAPVRERDVVDGQVAQVRFGGFPFDSQL